MNCCTSELKPGGFGFAVEVVGKGAVECLEPWQVCFDTGFDSTLELSVGDAAEAWKRSAHSISVAAVVGTRGHVAEYSNVLGRKLAVRRCSGVGVKDDGALKMKDIDTGRSRRTSVRALLLRQS